MDIDFKRMFTAILLCLAIMFGWQYYISKKYPHRFEKKPVPQAPATQPVQSQPGKTEKAPAADQPQQPVITNITTPGNWHLLKPLNLSPDIILGERIYRKGGYKAEITLESASAAVKQVLLSEYKWKVTDKEPGYPLINPLRDSEGKIFDSYMLGTFKLKDRAETFDLSGDCWTLVEGPTTNPNGTQTVTYRASIVNKKNKPVLDIFKIFTYSPENYSLNMLVRLENRLTRPLVVEQMEVYGPMGLLIEDPRIDRRNIVAAYFNSDSKLIVEHAMVTSMLKDLGVTEVKKPSGTTLRWLGAANKFFAATLCPVPTKANQNINYFSRGKVKALVLNVARVNTGRSRSDQAPAALTNISMEKPIDPAGKTEMHFDMYLGPIEKSIFDNNPQYAALGYQNLIYRRSCAMCSFDWLTYLLLKIMDTTYKVVGNYGVAIIILVLLVRLILHPISKKSQISMMNMSKMAPKVEEIKKKYAGNKEEIQRRTMEIYKEQGATPILGCLPMMLQMPIWIALYTAVDSNVALRHHGLLPASWHWLNDLAAPDRLIPFSVFGIQNPVTIPFLSNLVGRVDAINLLPILLTVAMFLQVKYSPQTQMSSVTNPQMAQQQKLMQYMMPVMMLLFFYTMPAGLNLYIMASTFGGLIEQHFIRKHLQEQRAKEEAGTVTATAKIINRIGPKKKKPKPPYRFMK